MRIILTFLVCCCLENIKSDISELKNLNFTQIAEKFGHKCEEFDVVTKDGYILKIFHIKGNNLKPILLGHGVIDSADSFIIRGNSSLAMYLADEDYDVWALNVRGTKYSRRHATLNPDTDKAYWDFSLHEIGTIDLAANIDFVLEKTKQSKLPYIGHSQGNQMSFVLGSERPEYNDKIKVYIALSPVAFLHHLPKLTQLLAYAWPVLSKTRHAMGQEELSVSEVLRSVCTNQEIGYELCARIILFTVMGSDPEQFEKEFSPIFFQVYPTSTSVKNVDHLVQIVTRKKFAQFDYGLKNLVKYGTLEPPNYRLDKITAPVVLLKGKNDLLSTDKDVDLLREHIPNPDYFEIEHEKMNHVDFMIGRDMKDYLFPVVSKYLQKYA